MSVNLPQRRGSYTGKSLRNMFQDALSKPLNTIMRCDSLTLHRLDIQLNFNTFVKKNPKKKLIGLYGISIVLFL